MYVCGCVCVHVCMCICIVRMFYVSLITVTKFQTQLKKLRVLCVLMVKHCCVMKLFHKVFVNLCQTELFMFGG